MQVGTAFAELAQRVLARRAVLVGGKTDNISLATRVLITVITSMLSLRNAIVKTRSLAAKALTKHGELGRRKTGVINTCLRGSSNADYLTARMGVIIHLLMYLMVAPSKPRAHGRDSPSLSGNRASIVEASRAWA